ncbi:DUF262 domain-containing protein [Variovorax boronicumulans]|uniref:DUF262 domain-containing protein n=1 Tax=Variovorax boronicumulans TaxID=436515 RepID=UPI00085C2816|nr:DUF262 domain-containing protein [Variovorax boronicumulans]OEZ31891.1 hypothetical protein AO062_06635 [Variovorax boronicumulans]
MSSFETNPKDMKDLLVDIQAGKIQLPDFQRGWVWEDMRIRELLVSVAQSFPVGAVMMLETGGEVTFEQRGVEGVEPRPKAEDAKWLILDGQQRLTTLTQVLQLKTPVQTHNGRGKKMKLFYYWDIEKALQPGADLLDAIVAVDERRQQYGQFHRDVTLDLSTREHECLAMHFPCNAMFDAMAWMVDLSKLNPTKIQQFLEFQQAVIGRFTGYKVPVIQLLKDTSKEAVCTVFEKVNTGGVALNVFELITATFAAEKFNLRDDWLGSVERNVQGRRTRLHTHDLLRNVEASDFIQSITLLETRTKRHERLAELTKANAGVVPDEDKQQLPPVSAKRKTMLALSRTAYESWAGKVEQGYLQVPSFLRKQSILRLRELPYQTQLVPLAAILAELDNKDWLTPVMFNKLSLWYWCGVLGELYGGAVETRIAKDVEEVLDWVTNNGPVPATVSDASFDAQRLDRLYTRNSAAYKGVNVLVLRQGAQDWYFKSTVDKLDNDDMLSLDIHHIFPEDWCKKRGIKPAVFNSIVNKTPISYKANRKIGGAAPSAYLAKLQAEKLVALDAAAMDALLETHQVPAQFLRTDDFEGFYAARKANLLALVEQAMGKAPLAHADASNDVDGAAEEAFAAAQAAEA